MMIKKKKSKIAFYVNKEKHTETQHKDIFSSVICLHPQVKCGVSVSFEKSIGTKLPWGSPLDLYDFDMKRYIKYP